MGEQSRCAQEGAVSNLGQAKVGIQCAGQAVNWYPHSVVAVEAPDAESRQLPITDSADEPKR